MTVIRSACALALSAALVSCGDSDSTSKPGGAESASEVDVRATIPPADPAKYIDFVGVDTVINPGVEKMYCVYFTYNGEDTAFYNQEQLQGKFGHHAVLLSSQRDLPDGTVEDCTEMKALGQFEPFSIPLELPPGVGVFLPKGKRVVMQFHYVNTGKKPIRVRDVARLWKRDPKEVKEWASVFVTNLSEFELAARVSTKKAFDCKLDKDVELLLIGGHMHEYGSSIKVEVGPNENELKQFHAVETWKPEYRDNPPMDFFEKNPVPFKAGTVIRTTCEWKNSEDHPLKFPAEMCVSFGYAKGIKQPFVCIDGKTEAKAD
jgi:hypothetical protein